MFQSTRPRGARHDLRANRNIKGLVSIHAPAWGATSNARIKGAKEKLVSIHAPAWGATEYGKAKLHIMFCFNPRARVGRDMIQQAVRAQNQKFQSTRPRGARLPFPKLDCVCSMGFNPRARVGRDCFLFFSKDNNPCFNPRARVGRDLFVIIYNSVRQMFQSTRPRGARHKTFKEDFCEKNGFNPRARVGRDLLQAVKTQKPQMFQSTRPRGARL